MHGEGWRWFFEGLHGAERPTTVRTQLERARSLIHDAYDEPLVVPTLAKQAAMSQSHFIRAFAREFGVTPRQYLIDVRLQHAKRLLQTTTRSVTEVCMDVGFSSLGSFSGRFSRDTGVSPRAFRRTLVQSLGILPACPPVPACFLARYASPT
ncbi:MAG: helix-turn-helix domain-containing protein [Nannocystaceae bacterium]|nr:AraC family transcriptional regulator [bacterium]